MIDTSLLSYKEIYNYLNTIPAEKVNRIVCEIRGWYEGELNWTEWFNSAEIRNFKLADDEIKGSHFNWKDKYHRWQEREDFSIVETSNIITFSNVELKEISCILKDVGIDYMPYDIVEDLKKLLDNKKTKVNISNKTRENFKNFLINNVSNHEINEIIEMLMQSHKELEQQYWHYMDNFNRYFADYSPKDIAEIVNFAKSSFYAYDKYFKYNGECLETTDELYFYGYVYDDIIDCLEGMYLEDLPYKIQEFLKE